MAQSQVTPRAQFDARAEPERIEGLLASAIAAQAGADPEPEHHAEAVRLLTDHAFRVLHNQVGELRREAVAEHFAGLRSPPGFWTMFAACLAALIVFGGMGLFLIARPPLLAHLISVFGG